jgi:hypothetical protein
LALKRREPTNNEIEKGIRGGRGRKEEGTIGERG